MTDLFSGLPVAVYAAAVDWHERFWGSEPSFLPNDVEAVWQVAEHGFVYVVVRPESAGRGVCTVFVDDLEVRVAAIAARGIEATHSETYENGVRKVTFHDPDGNEIGLGGQAHAG